MIMAVLLASPSLFSTARRTLASPSHSDLEAAKQRLAQLHDDFELAVERYNTVRQRLHDLHAQIHAGEIEVLRLRARTEALQKQAVTVAKELYKNGSVDVLEVILSSDSLANADARVEYLHRTQSEQAKVFEKLSIERRALTRKLQALRDARAQAQSAAGRLAALEQSIKRKMSAQQGEIERLEAAIERARQRRARQQEPAIAAASGSSPSSTASAAPGAPSTGGSAGETAAQAALSQVGKPYQWGAAGPNAYDCSGLTMWSWAHVGVSLPHSSSLQYSVTARVSSGQWAPGDLIFYGSPIHHVAIYVGGGEMVEAPYPGTTVREVPVRMSGYVGAGRP
jgi:cell wall-associated NlpC family hydrolase